MLKYSSLLFTLVALVFQLDAQNLVTNSHPNAEISFSDTYSAPLSSSLKQGQEYTVRYVLNQKKNCLNSPNYINTGLNCKEGFVNSMGNCSKRSILFGSRSRTIKKTFIASGNEKFVNIGFGDEKCSKCSGCGSYSIDCIQVTTSSGGCSGSCGDNISTPIINNESDNNDSNTNEQLDTDKDGLLDSEEKKIGTNWNNPDSDGDGLNDNEEVNGVNSTSTKLSPSGKSDPNDECDPFKSSSKCSNVDDLDTDKDGLLDSEEKKIGTNWNNPDSDGDGLNDNEEVNGVNSTTTNLTPSGKSDPNDECDPFKTASKCNTTSELDSDKDGILDALESKYKTDINNADSDGDGLYDGEEVLGVDNKKTTLVSTRISNPLDPCDPNANSEKCLSSKITASDKDGDGVLNAADRCPTIAGIKENDGCPALEDDVAKAFKDALTGIKFESSKDIIKEVSFPILDNVVDVLQRHKNYNVEIQGHTDSQGAEAFNLNLSEKRALSVKKYLEDKGVASSRLTSKGFGEAIPVGDNNTAAGRAQNRRVEFKLSY